MIGGQYNETIGQNQTTLVNLHEINNVVKFINIKAPLKWHVTNYEWDQFNNNSDRYLQTVNRRKKTFLYIWVNFTKLIFFVYRKAPKHN